MCCFSRFDWFFLFRLFILFSNVRCYLSELGSGRRSWKYLTDCTEYLLLTDNWCINCLEYDVLSNEENQQNININLPLICILTCIVWQWLCVFAVFTWSFHIHKSMFKTILLINIMLNRHYRQTSFINTEKFNQLSAEWSSYSIGSIKFRTLKLIAKVSVDFVSFYQLS